MSRSLAALAVACLALSPACGGEVMLQYYESRWETIEKRMADIFVAGYSSLWLPPPGKADTGGYSVGYDVFDRFNLGTSFDKTLYGTESSARTLVDTAHDAGLKVYFDYVMNHNGFRDASTPGFVSSGDYPGFAVTLPYDIDGDFHSAVAGGDQLMRLSGLIDIAQEKNHAFIRQPAEPDPQNIPGELPDSSNRRYYPDLALPANALGVHPFNTTAPLSGDPVVENATALLLRNAQWMVEAIGADGFRMDAVKHVPPFFFTDYFDKVMFQRGRRDLAGNPTTPFAFGEALTGDFSVLGRYRRRDSFANREVLDFPLFFKMRDVLSGSGFGDMRSLELASVDSIDGNSNDGSAGVMFAQSHDDNAPALENVAYAHILTRAGLPIVYHNALEFGLNRDFPRRGRMDAVGGSNALVPRLVDISRRYAKGTHKTRAIDTDVYVYERSDSLLVGLNDRGDSGYDERMISTDFRNVVLTELSGAAADPVVNANGDIPHTIAVDASGAATIRVPRNRTNATIHNRGFVIYGIKGPQHSQTLSPVEFTLPADGFEVPSAERRLTPIQVITGTTMTVAIQTSPEIWEDNAMLKLDGGLDIDGVPGVAIMTGEFAGFEDFTTSASPRSGGGTGEYVAHLDTTALAEGMHFLETIAFLPRPPGSPAVYASVRSALYLDRLPPAVELAHPSTTGNSDVRSQNYTVVARSSDLTADSMYVFFDKPGDYDFAGNVSESTRMIRVDRGEYRFDWSDISEGKHNITIVAFERTGRSSVTRYENIEARLPRPPMAFGVDVDSGNSSVNFQPMPSTIISRAYPNEFVVRVDQTGGLTFPRDYSVSLEVDGQIVTAEEYGSDKLPPVNRLVQHDQNPSDAFEEFRFLWRGYTHGPHSLIARALLSSPGAPPNSASATVVVHSGITGPALSFAKPQPGQVLNQPASIPVELLTDNTAESVQVFMSHPGGVAPFQLVDIMNSPESTVVDASFPVGSYQLSDTFSGFNVFNGEYTLKAVASTGTNGGGISSEASSTISVTGFVEPPLSIEPVMDSDIAEFFDRAPLATSMADGSGNSPSVADFGSDGSLTELHARIADNTLYLAVRGDMFNGTNPNANATIVYIDVDHGAGTGAQDMNSNSDLGDSSTQLRHLVRNSGFIMNSSLRTAGAGFDAAVIIDSTQPVNAKVYGFGTGGVPGSVSSFAELPVAVHFGTRLQSYPGAPGTSIPGPSGFEAGIPLLHLGNPDPGALALAVVTTSETAFPSPNTLPENMQNTFDNLQTLDGLARLPVYPRVLINEVLNGPQDYVEFSCASASVVPLGQWWLRWADANGASGYLPLTGLSVGADSNYSVAYDAHGPSPVPDGTIKLSHNLPWHPERGGSVAVIDPYGMARDYVRWKSLAGNPFDETVPAGANFAGYASGADGGVDLSLARSTNSYDSDAAADWTVQSASPGRQNPGTSSISDWMLQD